MLLSHLLPSIKLNEERRVLNNFNERFDAAKSELQRMQPAGDM